MQRNLDLRTSQTASLRWKSCRSTKEWNRRNDLRIQTFILEDLVFRRSALFVGEPKSQFLRKNGLCNDGSDHRNIILIQIASKVLTFTTSCVGNERVNNKFTFASVADITRTNPSIQRAAIADQTSQNANGHCI